MAGIRADDALHERAEAIHATGRGTILNYAKGGATDLHHVTADEFWKTLQEGGRWMDEPAVLRTDPVPRAASSAVVALTWEERSVRNPMSPLLSKIYQESNLRVRI
jgi:hypothetical protein